MSTPRTGERQAQRFRDLGYDIYDAGEERDIDTAADLAAVAETAPTTRTAGVARLVGLAPQVA